MSRRKQAHPSRHLDTEDGLAAPTASAAATSSTLPNGESSCSASDDDGAGTESGAQDGGMSDSGGSRLMQQTGEERACVRCHGEFPNLTAFLAHKVSCNKQDEDMGSSEEDEDLKRVGGELRRRRLQDAENNNGALLGHSGHEKDEFEDYEETAKSMASVMNLAPLLNLAPGAPPNPAAAAAMAAAAAAIPGAASLFPGLGGSTVTLEALQNTKVAVAQFAATALANNANNPAALQELAVLQSTLYTLQHQQMLQLNLIQQLQQQLQISRGSKEGSPVSPASIPRMQQDDILTPPSPPISIPSSLPLSSANIPLQHHPPSHSAALERQAEARLTESRHHIESRHERVMPERQQAPLTPSCLDRQQGTAVPATVLKQPQVTCTSSLGTTTTTPRLSLGVEPLPPSKPTPSTTPRIPSPPTSSCTPAVSVAPSISSSAAPLNIPPHPLHHQTGGGVTGCSISASLAASIITNTDPLPNSDEPNSLEMLQRRAQEVLDSASQGLLAGNLADELAFRGGAGGKGGSGKSGDGKRGNEPFFKHRCRYCGKVFGSDSALQIHIRSHTGERPFKCNVCGSRFTTKGNLKVHFQRHTAKFPHIKMNPNPVPEHLDKYHPPLLAQLQQSQSSSTSPPTTIPPHPAQNLPTLPPFPPPPAPPHLSQTFRPSLPPSHPLLNNKLSIPSPHPTTLSIPSIPAQQRLQQLVPPPSLPPPPPLHQFLPEQDVPENLSKPAQQSPLPRPSHTVSTSEPSSPIAAPQMQVKSEASDEESGEDECDEDEEADGRLHAMDLDVKHEVSEDSSPPPPPTSAPPSYRDEEDEGEQAPLEMDEEMEDSLGGGSSRAGDFCSDEEEDELLAATSASPGVPLQDCEDSQEQPENLSKSSPPTMISNSQTNTFLSNHSASSHGQRLPASYPFLGAVSPHSSTSSTGNNNPHSYSDHTHHDPSKDPAIYTSLLPRPGSNDNSWESLIEIDKTSETSKLQQLVDNIEHKLSDPNQCVVCHRVLSCKSALQMHYRTHTGERPFRCKICGRAFTTKGNLKTHMGVHRAKPPLRVLHQCPVCHRKFTNSLVLQQHIRLHTGEPTDLTPEQIQAAEIRDFAPPPPVSTSAGSYPNSPFLSHPPPLFPPLTKNSDESQTSSYPLMLNMEQTCKDEEQYSPPFSCTSLAALENQVRTVTTMAAQRATINGHDLAPQRSQSSLGAGSACSDSEDEDTNGRLLLSPSPSPTPVRSSCGSPSAESSSLGALDLTPRSTATVTTTYTTTSGGGFGLLPPPPPPQQPSFGAGGTFSPAAVAVLAAGYTNAASHPTLGPAVRGNTTCNICFKTFACNSALEIHYRSHTKERPFKCSICDRGFSTKAQDSYSSSSPSSHPPCVCDQWRIQQPPCTPSSSSSRPSRRPKRPPPAKTTSSATAAAAAAAVQGVGGNKKYSARFSPSHFDSAAGYAAAWSFPALLLGNMKQHMLTHKIRDMPQHLFDASQKHHQQQQQPQHIPPQGTPPSMPPKTSPLPLLLPPQQHCSNSNSEDAMSNAGDEKPPTTPTPEPHSGARTPELGQKRSPPDGDALLPIPKRPPGLPKHLCHVCNKNFSSSSALQIHMRTHTGDKPFKCTVCQKAFTTKGNLKVHMGTHMWNNGASRRGRRMSLDLPPIPMTPKDSEFLQRRPDLFYPYLPAPFLNGMQQKLNEISVIQSANSTGGLPSPPSKFGPPLGFAGLGLGYDKPLGLTMSGGNDLSRSASPSPDSSSKHGPTSPLSLVRHAASSPPNSAPPNMWDLHYRRLSPPERNGASSPPPQSQQSMMSLTPSPPSNPVQHPPPGTTPPQQLTTQRGESLVA